MNFNVDPASGESRTVFVTVTSRLSQPFTIFVSEARVWDAELFLGKLRERYPLCEVEEVTQERAEEIKRGYKAA